VRELLAGVTLIEVGRFSCAVQGPGIGAFAPLTSRL
jgi:hypothetical protein